MEDLRRTLHRLCSQGPSAKAELDRILAQHEIDPREDLRLVFGQFDSAGLKLLREKFASGDVISRAYRRCTGSRVQGCIYFWLCGVLSNNDFADQPFPSEEVLRASYRSIRAWDYGTIDAAGVVPVLDAVIRERELANAAEDEVARRAALADRTNTGPLDAAVR